MRHRHLQVRGAVLESLPTACVNDALQPLRVDVLMRERQFQTGQTPPIEDTAVQCVQALALSQCRLQRVGQACSRHRSPCTGAHQQLGQRQSSGLEFFDQPALPPAAVWDGACGVS